MSDVNQVTSDLKYVRRAVEQSQNGTPAAIYALWGALGFVGLSMVDFAPQYVGRFWLLAAPLGFVASVLLGRRAALSAGQTDAQAGRRHLWHWAGLLIGLALMVPLAVNGSIRWSLLAQLFLLFIAMVYFLAGIHLDRRLLTVGLLIAAGYVALLFSPPFAWTWTGIVVAAALWLCAYQARRDRAVA